ncbi:MAG: HAD family hydrolase, partial [Alphaproteobacteria bacterium]|nr:HAD family hydrolase [Alphaproteobacteria bacterium]
MSGTLDQGLPRPRALLFDWDNTLVDTWPTIHAAMNALLAAMGHEAWTMAETRARVRASAREAFPALFGARAEEARAIFYREFQARHLAELRPAPWAAAAIRDLSARGLYLGIVSNKRGDILRAEADHLGWTGYFGRLVGADDAERDKPDPAPVRLALAAGGLVPGPETWFIGDTGIDMVCGSAAGCTPVLVGAGP